VLDPKVFKAYDVRGIYPTEVDEEGAYAIGRAFVEQFEPEKIAVRTISDKETGAATIPDPNSPLLIIGDSHTLVFHDFLGEKSGLLDQLAYETGFAPDLIGTRGSGATSVRITLYRRTRKDPEYLAKKKVIVWCFAAREFTESDQGWEKVPVWQ